METHETVIHVNKEKAIIRQGTLKTEMEILQKWQEELIEAMKKKEVDHSFFNVYYKYIIFRFSIHPLIKSPRLLDIR